MAGIFGPTGREVFKNIQRDRALEAAAMGAQQGQLSPQQMMGQAGSFFGLAARQGLDAATGRVPPEVERANKLQAAQAQVVRSGVDAGDPVAFNNALAEALSAQGLVEEASMAGREAERITKERTEEANIQSLIAARMTAKEQMREDELTREARAAEGQAGRDSREEISRLDRESRERIAVQRQTREAKPKQARAASASDRSQAVAALQETLGEDTWNGLQSQKTGKGKEVRGKRVNMTEADDMAAFVAQTARDLTAQNPGMSYNEALDQAIEMARPGLGGDTSTFGGTFGEERVFTRPKAATQADDATARRARVDAILGR